MPKRGRGRPASRTRTSTTDTDAGSGSTVAATATDSSSVVLKFDSGSGKPQLVCHICQKALSSLTGFIAHLKKHEPPGGFVCTLCPARFCLKDQLLAHKDEAHKVLACRICQATFQSADEYQQHIQSQHAGIDRVMSACDKCKAVFKTVEAFKRHVATQCGTIKPFVCDECGAAFYSKYNLKNHKVIHAGKAFCCSFCGKAFSNKGRLVSHERSHTGEKPYKCDICGKSFAHRESLVTHSTLHTGIKPIACKRCDAKFSCHSNLIKHRRVRPDTCGLPQYDCKKEDRKPRASRINPLLMKSEIRVGKSAKILNPELKAARTKAKKEAKSDKEDPPAATSSTLLNNLNHSDESNDHFGDADTEVLPTATTPTLLNHSDESNDHFDTFDLLADSVKSEKADDLDVAPPSNFTATDIESLFLVNMDTDAELPPVKIEDDLDISDVVKEEQDPMADPKLSTICHVTLEDIAATIKTETAKVPTEEGSASESGDNSNWSEEDEEEKPKRRRKRKPRAVTKKPAAVIVTDPSEPKPKKRRNTVSVLKQIRLLKQMQQKVIFECKEPRCVKIYHFKGSFEKHLRRDHGKSEEEISAIVLTMEPDIEAQFGTKCSICGKMYLRPKRLESHMKFHGPDGSLKYKCPCYCNEHFTTKEEAIEHSKKEHKAQIFCTICDKFFLNSDALGTHRRSQHDTKTKETPARTDRNLVCGMCGKRFYSRTYLNDHERSNCGTDPIYKCNICGKSYTTAGILKTHMLLHKDETPYLCQLCGKTFKVQAQYKTHLKVRHTEDKPFKCQICPKAYPYRESLLTHMTVHTGFKRYQCNGCGSRYSCISNLQAHRKVHANSCGLLPLNSKPSEYMGVVKGVLLSGVKPFS